VVVEKNGRLTERFFDNRYIGESRQSSHKFEINYIKKRTKRAAEVSVPEK
jgi:hypothetical protein